MTTGFTKLIINSHERLERLKKKAETEDISNWKEDADREAYLDYMKDPKDRKGETVILKRRESRFKGVADMSKGEKWTNKEYGILIDGYMDDKSLEDIKANLPKRSMMAVKSMIHRLELPKKYYKKHGLDIPEDGNYQLRRDGVNKSFKDEEVWIVWYLKHNTNLSNREIGEYLGRSKGSIRNIITIKSLLTREPTAERPINLESIIKRLMGGMSYNMASKEAAECQ